MYWLIIAVWNCFLAAIPFAISFLIFKKFRNRFEKLTFIDQVSLVLLTIFWIGFFPNIPYLMTGFRHISDICIPNQGEFACHEISIIIPFILLYTCIGIYLFYSSVEFMRKTYIHVFSLKNGFVVPNISIPLSALGILIGLRDRFNSWDLLSQPGKVLNSAFHYLISGDFLLFFIFSIVLLSIYYSIFFLLFRSKHKL